MSEARWSIDELLVRYELEPSLVDVYVEGSFDCDILRQAAQDRKDAIFYPIDVVDVPADLLQRFGLTSGNKQRLIALAREFSNLPHEASVFCLVDRDFDHFVPSIEDTPRLKRTEFCCMESHFISLDIVNRVMIVAAGARIPSICEFMNSLVTVLTTLFALRLAATSLDFALAWVALRKYLNRNGSVIDFDHNRYVIALLGSNAKLSERQRFLDAQGEWRRKLDGDVRQCARGHDFTEILAWAVRPFEGYSEFASEVAIRRLFVLLASSIETLPSELQLRAKGSSKWGQNAFALTGPTVH